MDELWRQHRKEMGLFGISPEAYLLARALEEGPKKPQKRRFRAGKEHRRKRKAEKQRRKANRRRK